MHYNDPFLAELFFVQITNQLSKRKLRDDCFANKTSNDFNTRTIKKTIKFFAANGFDIWPLFTLHSYNLFVEHIL